MKNPLFKIHLAVFLWGFTGIFGKLISLSAPVLVWYRMLITVAFLAVIIAYRKEIIIPKKADRKRIFLIGMLYAIHWVAFYASIKLANASIAMVCLATASVFTALLDPLMNKRKIKPLEILVGLIALMGVLAIYLLQPDDADFTHGMVDFKLGVLLGVGAAVLSTIFTIFNKPLTEHYPARTLVCYEMGTGWLFLTLLAPVYIFYMPQEPLLPQGWDFLWLLMLGYFCTVWAQSLAMSALKKLSPFTVTLSVNIEPIYGIILAFFLFQENKQLGYGFYIGMFLIFISLLLQMWLGRRQSHKTKAISQTT